MEKKNILDNLKNKLIVSCQALKDEPLNSSFIMSKMAKAALEGGACAIRSNSIEDINAIKKETGAIVIGIIKKEYSNSDIHITPTNEEIKKLLTTSCEIIAIDATTRKRPKEPLKEQVNLIREKSNKLLMADCSTLKDVEYALENEFDIISSTLVGYTEESVDIEISNNDFSLLKEMITLTHKKGKFFIAEGNINTPEKAKRVIELGADSVVVGSAITRPQIITENFVKKIEEIV